MFTQFQSDFCKTQFAARYPVAAAAAGNRVESAARILAANAIRKSFDLPGVWEVKSESVGNRWYQIEPARKTCSCPDHRAGHLCKHRLAVGYMLSLAQWAGEHADHVVDGAAKHIAQRNADQTRSVVQAYANAEEIGSWVRCLVTYQAVTLSARIVDVRQAGDCIEAKVQVAEHMIYARHPEIYWPGTSSDTIWVRASDCQNPKVMQL